MQKMKTLGTIFIGNLDPKSKEKILSYIVPKDKMKEFEDREKLERVSTLADLKDLLSHNESEVLNTLNSLYYNSQFFTYCGPLLININPGPGRIYDYLNLQKWMGDNTSKADDSQWKPHLYSYLNYIYQTLCREKQDQVVNMLGQVGSGKTFNLVHIIEYLTVLAGPENYQVELFDMIHKSIQLIHIMGSIYRQNNVESTCCSLLLKLGFDEKNKINAFDIESKIVDFTLPFSENGRSYTILHAIMCANSDLKKNLELPETEQGLNFYKKFLKNFDQKTREKFKMNDLEIWTRFHSLLNYFGFQKNEIYEILQLLSFVILLNECAIGRKKFDHGDEYFLNKSTMTKKVAKNIGIPEDDFLIKLGCYKSINDVKAALIKLMKYSYFLVFEYIKSKVKRYSNKYFEVLREELQKTNSSPASLKNLYFIDIPSEVDDQTLGGLSTNLSNECLNLFASHQYLSLVEKLEKEKISLNFVKQLHCVDVVNALTGENGLCRLLSKKFNEKLFYRFRSKCNSIPHLRNTIQFSEPDNLNNNNKPDQYVFKFKFSQKSVVYNLESLSLEAKSMSLSKRLFSVLEMSQNKVLKIILKKENIRTNLLEAKTFYHFVHYNISEIFSPLQGLSPFIIYCFHSNNSLRIFFGEKVLEKKPNWNIPERLTNDLCKNSLIMPVLYWEWFGYHEWISIDKFINEYAHDFESVKDKLLRSKGKQGKSINIEFNKLKKDEICLFILSILLGEKHFIIGQNYILLKKGYLKDIRKILDNLNELHRINRKTASVERKENQKKTETKESKDNRTKGKSSSVKGEEKKSGINSQFSIVKKKDNKPASPGASPFVSLKKNSLRVLCPYTILDETNSKRQNEMLSNPKDQPSILNLYKFLTLPEPEQILNNSIDVSLVNANADFRTQEEHKTVEDYTKKNNVIVANNLNIFNVFKNTLLIQPKDDLIELFDYSDYLKEINKIASCYKAYLARKKYKVFRYCVRRIVGLQKYIRAWVIRNKFKRYLDVTKKVGRIQRCFKKLLSKKIKAARYIQILYRKFIKRKKERGELYLYSEKKENSKLAEELFEVGNLEREKRKSMRIMSLSKVDIETTEPKAKKEAEPNDEQMLEELMNMGDKSFFGESLASLQGDKKKVKKKPKKGEKRIEDKLIEHGELLKKKKNELKLQKIKEEESELIFKPKTNFAATKNGQKFNQTDFFNRMSLFKNKHDIKMEEMRNRRVDHRMNDFTFKPKLSKIAEQVGKRTVQDLYNWKFRKEENLSRLIQQKMEEEEKKLMEECSKKYRINTSSEIILQQKMERISKVEHQEDDEQDLWPVQMQKKFFEKKQDE